MKNREIAKLLGITAVAMSCLVGCGIEDVVVCEYGVVMPPEVQEYDTESEVVYYEYGPMITDEQELDKENTDKADKIDKADKAEYNPEDDEVVEVYGPMITDEQDKENEKDEKEIEYDPSEELVMLDYGVIVD